MHDVPPRCTAAGTPARVVKRAGQRVDEDLPRTQLSEASIPVPDEDAAQEQARG
jgi:serine acetyltransferase